MNSYPMIIGADIARRGADANVLSFRQHLDARRPQVKLRGQDLMAVAARIAAEAHEFRARGMRVVLMIDGTGLGAGVVDRLRQLGGGYYVHDVQFGGKASNPQMYANLRAEMHGELRAWIRKGGALPHDPRLLEQMAAIEFGHTGTGQILLEPKDRLRDRLGYSPDELDSLACTFAIPVMPEIDEVHRVKRNPGGHDPYAYLRDRSGRRPGHNPYAPRR